MNTQNCSNIPKSFLMLRGNAGSLRRLPFALLLLTGVALILCAVTGHAASRIDEIRLILSQKALFPQSSIFLKALNMNNLDASLRAMDPYARYVPAASLPKDPKATLHLGIDVYSYKSRAWLRPDPGGPADKAGVPEISELCAINGKRVTGTDLDRISALLDEAMRDGRVDLTIARQSGCKGRHYHVNPVAYRPSSITWRRVGADLVLQISEFVSHDTAPGLSARIRALVRPGNRTVIDLRGCSGGDLYEALEIAGMFVPAGRPLASTYDRSGKTHVIRSPTGKKLRSPSLLLIDRRTASAAEILVGVLQYYHLATVVGERSYGKCVSQTLVPLATGGGLWLTTMGINFPDSSSCTGAGIKPDISFPDVSVARLSDICKH